MFVGSNLMKKFGLDDVVDAVSVTCLQVFWCLVVPISNPDASFVGQLTGVVSIFLSLYFIVLSTLSIKSY